MTYCLNEYSHLHSNATSTSSGNDSHPTKMVASSTLSLTEELFRVTQLNKYKEVIEPIMPGSGLPEKLFKGIQSEQMEKR